MSSICRAFTLFHDKLMYNANKDKISTILQKDYIVIGYFDWFSTEAFSLDNYKENSLTELYQRNSLLNETNSEFQSFQNTFGFIDNKHKSDFKFWKDDPSSILTFVIFLQFEHYSATCYDVINSIIKDKKSDNCKHIIYHTLDKNDFIVCLKSNEYRETVDLINDFFDTLNDYKLNIVYSYTNLVVKNSVINDDSAINKLTEKIDSICIKTILNNFNSSPKSIPDKIRFFLDNLIPSLYGDLDKDKVDDMIKEKEIVGYEILGDTDCRFIARKVPLNQLLRLYSKNGLLMRDNDDFAYCFVSSMTSLNVCFEHAHIEESFDKSNRAFLNNNDTASADIEIINNLIDSRYQSIIVLLHQINNYILYLNYQASEYELYSIKKPFLTLINIIKTNIENINNNKLVIDDLYEYLNNIYTNIQENIRTDIRFFGISDFSMLSYYSPTKLRAFYSFVISSISKYYSSMSSFDKEINYDFLFFFTQMQTTNVSQLWRDRIEEDKLMMVKISELDFYDVRDLIFQLAHEAAHFVGNEEIRNRALRYKVIIEYLFYQIYYLLIKTLNQQLDTTIAQYLQRECENLPFERFYSINKTAIQQSTDSFISELVLDGKIKNERSFFYMNNIDEYIEQYLFKHGLIFKFFNEYYHWLIQGVKAKLLGSGNTSYELFHNIVDELEDFRKEIPIIINNYKWDFIISKHSDYEYIRILIRECYADLSAVFLFNLSIEEYFDTIIKHIKRKPAFYTTYSENILFQRGCIVAKAMAAISLKHPEMINPSYSDFLESSNSNDKSKRVDYEEIIKTIQAIETNYNHPAHFVYSYIAACLEGQCKNHNEQKRKELIKNYTILKSKNAIDVIKFINQYVANCFSE